MTAPDAPTRGDSYTRAPLGVRISNRYDRGISTGENGVRAVPATRTSDPDGFWPLVGDWATGAVAFRPPGAVAAPSAWPAPLGDTGLGDCLPHATAMVAVRRMS